MLNIYQQYFKPVLLLVNASIYAEKTSYLLKLNYHDYSCFQREVEIYMI